MKPHRNAINLSPEAKQIPAIQIPEPEADRQTWQAFRQGDQQAFGLLYHQHVQALFRFGCQLAADRELVKDCIQDLFVELRQRQAYLGEVVSVKAYLFRSLYRRIMRATGKKKWIIPFAEPALCDKEGFLVTFSHERSIINHEQLEQQKAYLEKAINQLPLRQRQAMLYHFKEGMSYEEIACVMGLQQVHSARKLIYKAIATLKEGAGPLLYISTLGLLLTLLWNFFYFF